MSPGRGLRRCHWLFPLSGQAVCQPSPGKGPVVFGGDGPLMQMAQERLLVVKW